MTAETVILALENVEDYKAFERAIAADYDGETALERELILRLASLLWRLRRATSIETGLLQIQAEILRGQRRPIQRESKSPATMAVVHLYEPAVPVPLDDGGSKLLDNDFNTDTTATPTDINVEVARCFCGLAELENGVFERLGRYETALWRQVRQTAFTLDALQRRGSGARYRGQLFWRRRREVSIDHDLG